MYPNLSYILHSIFGTEPDNAFSVIQTFGLFLALSFVVACCLYFRTYYRSTSTGRKNLIGSGPIMSSGLRIENSLSSYMIQFFNSQVPKLIEARLYLIVASARQESKARSSNLIFGKFSFTFSHFCGDYFCENCCYKQQAFIKNKNKTGKACKICDRKILLYKTVYNLYKNQLIKLAKHLDTL